MFSSAAKQITEKQVAPLCITSSLSTYQQTLTYFSMLEKKKRLDF